MFVKREFSQDVGTDPHKNESDDWPPKQRDIYIETSDGSGPEWLLHRLPANLSQRGPSLRRCRFQRYDCSAPSRMLGNPVIPLLSDLDGESR